MQSHCRICRAEGWVVAKYDLTPVARAAMRVAQGGLCSFCGTGGMIVGGAGGPKEVVDHHPGTRRVRGLAHSGCNAAVGSIGTGDDPMALRGLAEYLEEDKSVVLAILTAGLTQADLDLAAGPE